MTDADTTAEHPTVIDQTPATDPAPAPPEKSIAEQADELGSIFHELGDLAPRVGRVFDKLGKALVSAEKYTGPMSRPMSDTPARYPTARKPQEP